MSLSVIKLSVPVAVGTVPGAASVEIQLPNPVITGVEIDFQGTTGLDKVGVQLLERSSLFCPDPFLSPQLYIWHRGYQVRWTDHYELTNSQGPWNMTVAATNLDTANIQIVEVRITSQRVTVRGLLEFIANALDKQLKEQGNILAKIIDLVS